MLEVRDLHAGYGDKEIVHGVSFTIERGQFVCVIGANLREDAAKELFGL